jgi:hypothetical protein
MWRDEGSLRMQYVARGAADSKSLRTTVVHLVSCHAYNIEWVRCKPLGVKCC